MIRRNIVSVVAACGALAVGIALGGGPLSDLGHADPKPVSPRTQATGEVREQAATGSAFAKEVGPRLLAGTLTGQRVTVFAMPGADPSTVQALAAQVKTAGGAVGNTVQLLPAALDPARKAFADTLSTQLGKQFGDRIKSGLSTYPRLGQVVGATYGAHVDVSASTAEQVTASKTLVAGKLVRVGADAGPGTLGVLVLGERTDPTLLTGFVEGLGGALNGLVVAGDTASADTDLRTLRAQKWGPWFASVDGVDTNVGLVATGLALARQVHQRGGSFGASGFGGITATG